MLDEMPARVWDEWQAFDEMQPIGDWRGDLHIARVMAMYASTHRDRKQQPQPYTPKEFMVIYDPDEAAQASGKTKTPEQMLSFVEMMNAALGGRDLRIGQEAPETTESEKVQSDRQNSAE